jgi:hypothetical protein
MSTKTNRGVVNSWDVLATHNWNDTQSIETTVSNALLRLNCKTDGKPLYDYIDLEAATETLGSKGTKRGASEIRFDYENYEIRILQDGTVAARERSVVEQPLD